MKRKRRAVATVQVDADVLAALRRLAQEEHVSVNDLVRALILAWDAGAEDDRRLPRELRGRLANPTH